MNILYYLGNYPKLSETWVKNEISELRKRGHQVAVFSHHAPDEPSDELADIHSFTPPEPSLKGFRHLEFSEVLNPTFYQTLLWTKNPLRQAYSIYYASYASSYVDSLPFDIDHIHGHFAMPPQVPANYVARLYDLPHTLMTHAYDLYGFDHTPTREYLYRHSDRILTISEYNREYMEKEANCTLDVNVVPACFDANKFEPTEGHIENRILTVARHVEKKGIEYALRSIANIDTKVDYRVIGTGPRTEYLKELTEDLKIKDQVSFLGRVSDERLKREMDEAQLFLLPCVVAKNGDRDGVPVSIKEAMAMKTPPVTTTVSGIPEIVDESCGYLSPPKDVESLCNSIKEGLNSRSNDIGRNAQQRIQSHKSEKVVDDLIKIFHELV